MINRRLTIFRLIIFGLTFLAFSRLIPCEFTWWDDQDTIHQNTRINLPSWEKLGYYWTNAGANTTMGLYVPVTYTVWSGLAWIAHRDQPDGQGIILNAWVFHLANVLLHALTAVAVFELLRRLLGGDLSAAIGALLFGLHPVQVESVGWVSGTKDLLCGLFSVCALLMYVRSMQIKAVAPHLRGPTRWRYLLGLLFFMLGMLSKPTAVVVPLMAASIAIFVFDLGIRQVIFSLWPWFVLMIPCLIWTQKVQPAPWSNPLPVWSRPMIALDAIAFYLHKLVWPMHLGIDYGNNPVAIVANHHIYFTWILPVGLAMLLWWRRKQSRMIMAACLLFLLPLGPILGLVPFEFQIISTTSDHYLYLPMVGAALCFAWAVEQYKIPRWIVAAILIGLSVRTVLQEPAWQNSRSLFHNALAVNPRSVPALDGLGFVTGRDARRLSDAGKNLEARPLFEESIDWYRRSLVYDPTSVPSMLNLALDYQKIGRTDLGLAQIHRMVQVQHEIPQGLRADPISLAHLLVDFGDLPGAIGWLDEVLRQDPTNINAAVLRERAIYHQRGKSVQ